MTSVPKLRVQTPYGSSLDPDGAYVLYWMTAFRRLGWNYALQHAAEMARELGKPLVIFELLLVDYPYASSRLHTFMLEGMAERSEQLKGSPVFHYPFVERAPGEGRGLFRQLASEACVVVSDEYPCFIIPEMVAGPGSEVGIRFDLVDSNGLLPLRASDRVFSAAYHFRRFLQKTLPDHLPELPNPDPLGVPLAGSEGAVAERVLRRWPPANGSLLRGERRAVSELPLDLSVSPSPMRGGTAPARALLDRFLTTGLGRYHEDRNHPDRPATSGLSPYLHFGNISSHEVFVAVSSSEGWTPLRLSLQTDGSRSGWWGMSKGAESFLDQLVTWRELGFNMSFLREDYKEYVSLPEWARITLEEHEIDERPHLYDYSDFLEARTADPLWNAAQRQLLEEGMIHNYLRMLWGKKILEWTPSAREALDIMIDLNDRFALDGRDPNSYSGIFWCLGRYDRGWTERPVFGKVRSMSSERTRKKVDMESYLERFGSDEGS
ncbi:MAG: FAD-binding domain-containing protein [Gemmatimonadota bacterium]|jgi:deoxyribodipyrimidine photo-lyase